MTDVAELGLKVDSRQVVQADKALDGFAKSASMAEDSVEKLNSDVLKGEKANKSYSTSTTKAAKNTSRLQNAAGNASFQIADLAVQLEGGTSFARAFGQQGSQLLGAFGPFGAIAGAAVAVTAALASQFMEASLSSEELSDKITELTEDFADLTEAQRLFLADEQADKIQDQGSKIADLADDYRDTTKAISDARQVLESVTKQYEAANLPQSQIATLTESYKEKVVELERELRKLDAELDTENKVLANLREGLIDITGAYDDVGDAVKKSVLTPAESLVANLRAQSETLGLTAAQAQLYRLELTEGVNPALLEEAAALQTTIDAYNAKAKAQKEADQESRRAEAAQDRANAAAQRVAESLLSEEEQVRLSYQRRAEIIRQSTEMTEAEKDANEILLARERNQQIEEIERERISKVLEMNEGLFSGLSGLAAAYKGEQSTLYRGLFAIEKGFAVARALINIPESYSEAYSATVGIPIIGPALAPVAGATAAAAQVAQAASIRSTTASFDGGGFTGFGPRSGGEDGKGGFMAMLHPNETVIDHTKGNSGGMAVNVQVLNYGADSVRTESDGNNLRVIIGEVKKSISSDIDRGVGPVNKSLQSTFGLNRKGNR